MWLFNVHLSQWISSLLHHINVDYDIHYYVYDNKHNDKHHDYDTVIYRLHINGRQLLRDVSAGRPRLHNQRFRFNIRQDGLHGSGAGRRQPAGKRLHLHGSTWGHCAGNRGLIVHMRQDPVVPVQLLEHTSEQQGCILTIDIIHGQCHWDVLRNSAVRMPMMLQYAPLTERSRKRRNVFITLYNIWPLKRHR